VSIARGNHTALITLKQQNGASQGLYAFEEITANKTQLGSKPVQHRAPLIDAMARIRLDPRPTLPCTAAEPDGVTTMRDHQNQSGGCILVAVVSIAILMWVMVLVVLWIQ
jgi:hypothetical protein